MGTLWIPLVIKHALPENDLWMASILLVRFTQGMDGLLRVAGMMITSDDMDHSRKFPA